MLKHNSAKTTQMDSFVYIKLIKSCCRTFLATETNGASARSMLVHKTTNSTDQAKGLIM